MRTNSEVLICDHLGCEAREISSKASGWYFTPQKHYCPTHSDAKKPPLYNYVRLNGNRYELSRDGITVNGVKVSWEEIDHLAEPPMLERDISDYELVSIGWSGVRFKNNWFAFTRAPITIICTQNPETGIVRMAVRAASSPKAYIPSARRYPDVCYDPRGVLIPNVAAAYDARQRMQSEARTKEPPMMNFANALNALNLGHKVKRHIWVHDRTIEVKSYGDDGDKMLLEHHGTQQIGTWLPSCVDIFATDWELG